MVHSINPLASPSSMRGKEAVVEEINEEIDLSLSLSLNGRFGVDPQRNHKLTGAPMDANRRSLHSSGSLTISYFQNQSLKAMDSLQNRANGREFKKVSEMPHVCTTISGRKINGYLSKYNQEETRILCACHAFSMTPAEFIKHAGGGDVAFPERHITVMPVVGDGEVVNPHY
ncbi:ninja-family protein AFP3-like [Apium graveolens]|uniref:ninja-family protein AFP3-like n=1 Tax=Apium graveolens TaxID=4045 RepID=UPI003D7B2BBC